MGFELADTLRFLRFSASTDTMRFYLRTFLSCLWMAAAGLPAAEGSLAEPMAPTEPRPPDIVFIVIDDVGWMDPGVQGSIFYETPPIDGLAGRGVRS